MATRRESATGCSRANRQASARLLGVLARAAHRQLAVTGFWRLGVGVDQPTSRPVPDDPDVARSGLESIERLVEAGGGRLGRPALADFSDLAGCGELAQPAKRLRLL